MIFFRKLITWRFWLCSPARAALGIFAILWFHGSLIGLSDDEAYYWVLAQKPALGYAFHPPAVAWCIAFFQKLAMPFFGANSPWIVRLPAALLSSLSVALGMAWLKMAGAEKRFLVRGGVVLLYYAG